ncbi:hypothetical protein N7467_005581 [Penicillium canescens]|nr:hypothetical protein N7467_005581 [Penicillium canescens]
MSTPEHNRAALAAPNSSASHIQPLLLDESFLPETDDFYIPDSAELYGYKPAHQKRTGDSVGSNPTMA